MYHKVVADYFFQPIGAFVCWMFKGFKGNIENEFNVEKKIRNIIVGVFVIAVTAILTGFFKS